MLREPTRDFWRFIREWDTIDMRDGGALYSSNDNVVEGSDGSGKASRARES